ALERRRLERGRPRGTRRGGRPGLVHGAPGRSQHGQGPGARALDSGRGGSDARRDGGHAPFAALPVCPVLDARKREVYASLYRWDGLGMRREWEYLAIAPDDLARRLDEPVMVVGDGAHAIGSPYARRIQPPRRGPAPAVVGSLGHARLAVGDAVAAADLTPIYLRPSEAELK